jgi:hypothetical protein
MQSQLKLPPKVFLITVTKHKQATKIVLLISRSNKQKNIGSQTGRMVARGIAGSA